MTKDKFQKSNVEITHFYRLIYKKRADDFDIFYSGGYAPKGRNKDDDNFSTITCYKILQLLFAEVDVKNLPFEYVHLKTGETVLVASTLDDDDVVLIQDDGPEMMIMIFEGQHQLQKVVLPLFKQGKLDEQIIKHQQKEIKVRQV